MLQKYSKILIAFIVVILVVLLGWGFQKIFHFEDNKTKTKSFVTDEYVDKLYSQIAVDVFDGNYTFYNGYFTQFSTLNNQYVLKIAFLSLKEKVNLADYEVETFSSEVMTQINNTNIKPRYQIKKDVFVDAIKEFFGDKEPKYTSFSAGELNFYYDEATATFYGYELDNSSSKLTDYVILRQKISYEITNKGQNLIIYEYFGKCNKLTQECFNDTRISMPNRDVKYREDMAMTQLVKYKHTFNLAGDHYYWNSSEISEN